jgi:hypothetical protein
MAALALSPEPPTRAVSLEEAIGLGTRDERTALLRRAFETQHDVREHYYGSRLAVAVALVKDPADPRRERLEVVCAPEVRLEQEIEELLFRAAALAGQVHLTFETGRDRAICLQMVYAVIAGIFKELDRAAATDGAATGLAYLEKACERADTYFRRAAQRRAQLRYLGGMLGALLALAAIAFVPSLRLTLDSPLTSLIAGGVGALLSVLHGMTSGNLRLHTLFASAESGLGPLVAAGALRPLLGALSALVVFVLIKGGLVPLEIPTGDRGAYFMLAIAIVAGFSERLARGVLAGTEQRLDTSAAQKS